MTDIVERLRAASYGSHGLKAEAADEIARLRAENLIREGERMKTLARMALEIERLTRTIERIGAFGGEAREHMQ